MLASTIQGKTLKICDEKVCTELLPGGSKLNSGFFCPARAHQYLRQSDVAGWQRVTRRYQIAKGALRLGIAACGKIGRSETQMQSVRLRVSGKCFADGRDRITVVLQLH